MNTLNMAAVPFYLIKTFADVFGFGLDEALMYYKEICQIIEFQQVQVDFKATFTALQLKQSQILILSN